MIPSDSLKKRLPEAASLEVREVLGAAWPLFQVSLPACLPLAIVGVAASGVPGAEAAANGEPHGFLHSRDWWGVYCASTALMLICYGAVLRQQLAWAVGQRAPLLESLRRSALALPATLLLVILAMLPLAPAIAWTALRHFGGMAAVLWATGVLALMGMFFAWPVMLAEHLAPWAAVERSLMLVRPRWRAVLAVTGALVAAVLVFVLMTGILMAVVMNLAGQGVQTGPAGLSFSRWLMAAVLALPVVYGCAVSVVAYRAVTHRPAAR